jgi:hypothetical protein
MAIGEISISVFEERVEGCKCCFCDVVDKDVRRFVIFRRGVLSTPEDVFDSHAVCLSEYLEGKRELQ